MNDVRLIPLEDEETGETHFVEVHVSQRSGLAGPAGTTYVSCRCPKGVEYWEKLKTYQHDEGCWAMVEARLILNIEAP